MSSKTRVKILVVTLVAFLSMGVGYSGENDDDNGVWCGFEDSYLWFADGDVGRLLYVGVIGRADFGETLKALSCFEKRKVSRIVVSINSDGGSYAAGVGIAQLLMDAASKFQVETYGSGVVASAAIPVLMAGSVGHRYAHDGTTFMMHQVFTYQAPGFVSAYERERKLKVASFREGAAQRFLLKRVKMSQEELRDMVKEETWFTANRAREIGIIDHIIPVR